MKRVTGIGGIFFQSKDADGLRAWYEKHLGIEPEPYGGKAFRWREEDDPDTIGMTVWSINPDSSDYFQPSRSPFMVNYRVDDLHALLDALRKEGVAVDDKVEESEYGKFGWVMDPDGNKVELWEPPAEYPAE